jgi:hypothetical protein
VVYLCLGLPWPLRCSVMASVLVFLLVCLGAWGILLCWSLAFVFNQGGEREREKRGEGGGGGGGTSKYIVLDRKSIPIVAFGGGGGGSKLVFFLCDCLVAALTCLCDCLVLSFSLSYRSDYLAFLIVLSHEGLHKERQDKTNKVNHKDQDKNVSPGMYCQKYHT